MPRGGETCGVVPRGEEAPDCLLGSNAITLGCFDNILDAMKKLEVVVVGAGIGGLQTALALAADGHMVTVLESAKSFEEVSAKAYPYRLRH